MITKKTDNHNSAAKLALRRHYLRTYHGAGDARVLDCFQGGGKIWGVLQKEFTLASYWGLDLKPRKGRLKIDSCRVLDQAGWQENVIDLDAYGSPWKHFQAVVRNASGPCTVFLTIGMIRIGGGNFDRSTLEMFGANFRKHKIPNSLGVKMGEHILDYAAGFAAAHGFKMCDVQEAFPQKNARYLGLRLEKAA